jgi:hypothetical protein
MPQRTRPTTYLIRAIPYQQWLAFKARAARENVTVRALLIRWIVQYAEGMGVLE